MNIRRRKKMLYKPSKFYFQLYVINVYPIIHSLHYDPLGESPYKGHINSLKSLVEFVVGIRSSKARKVFISFINESLGVKLTITEVKRTPPIHAQYES